MKRLASAILSLILILNLSVGATAADYLKLDSAYELTADYCVKKAVGLSYGSEWLTLALCRGGAGLPKGELENYLASVADTLKARNGVLSSRKYTEYSRVIIGLTAAGCNAAAVGGYDLTAPLGDYDATVSQGVNGPVWALLALDSGLYAIPANGGAKTQATRKMYVDFILSRELSGGGWAFSGSSPDPDMTAMALCALAKYRSQTDVSAAVSRALELLSRLQNSGGGFSSSGSENSESCSQAIIALCELGISLDDGRLVKNGSTILDRLLSFRLADGSFEHIKGGGSDGTATEQALLALAAAKRSADGKVSLYRMLSFKDIQGNSRQNEIEALANAGIISGMGGGLFAPDKSMTRAEFCAVVVKALGLTLKKSTAFTDVSESAWFSSYVGAAFSAGIVKGSSTTTFTPDGSITYAQADIMLSRAAVTLGLRDKADEAPLSSSVIITRGELASKLFTLLKEAGKI